MFYYQVVGVALVSCFKLPSFTEFMREPFEGEVTLERTEEQPPEGQDLISGEAKGELFADIQKCVTGQMSAEAAVEAAIRLNEEQYAS